MTTETLTPKQIAFEIGFALGQTGAQTFINCHSKSPEIRMKAIALLTEHVAARFAKMTVLQEVPDFQGRCSSGWEGDQSWETVLPAIRALMILPSSERSPPLTYIDTLSYPSPLKSRIRSLVVRAVPNLAI